MNFWRVSTRSVSVAALLLSFVTLISTNIYFASSASDSISGCVNKKTGILRIATKCLSAERVITWNRTGSQGLAGLAGPQGLAGPIGPEGPVGQIGSPGVPGNNGSPGSSGSRGPAGFYQVYDAAGSVVGPLVMGDAQGVWAVLWDGIPIRYSPTSGNIVDNQDGFYFMNPSCTGDVYFRSGSNLISQSDTSTLSANWQSIQGLSNSHPLFVTKVVSGSRVGTDLMIPVGQSARIETATAYHLFQLEDFSPYTCNIRSGVSYNRYFLLAPSSHPSPSDRVGPLTIRGD